MSVPRRHLLRLIAGVGFAKSLVANSFRFDVDRLASECKPRGAKVLQRRYRAGATVTILSVPIFFRQDVGSGFAVIEEAATSAGNTVAIRFGAGSFPATAHGVNRLGYIEEVVVERPTGQVDECAYFGFMTSSQEKNLDQAKAALENRSAAVPYAVAEGAGRQGIFSSRVHRMELPAQLTWRDYPTLMEKVRAQILEGNRKTVATGESAPATFLYAVRKALVAPGPRTSCPIIYNGGAFLLETVKRPDHGRGAMRLDATLRDQATGQATRFKLWFKTGSEHMPPVRIEYQAKAFLRLTFEFDPQSSALPADAV